MNDLSTRFAFILHADVVGSTAMVRRNEHTAHERIRQAFTRLASAVTEHGGETVEVRGDALVAVFDKASDAVSCALGFQADNTRINRDLADPLTPEIRIGIGMGEVIVADNTVTGPGVVLSQRLEQLAAAGGVVIQGAVYEAIPQRLPFAYSSLGEQQVKGFDEPVKAYQVTAESSPPETPAGAEAPAARPGRRKHRKAALALLAGAAAGLLTLAVVVWLSGSGPTTVQDTAQPAVPDGKPSIAVLPFDNLSGDPEQEYFSDGISEDIITDLSRLANLNVIARNSSFTYKGSSVNIQQVGRELGVKYVLEGSVRKAGDRLRINAQLIDAGSGHHLWADRFDRELTDVFALQDQITQQIVSALSIRLSDREKQQLERSTATDSFESYDVFLKGLESATRSTPTALSNGIDLFREAIRLDPGFARAYGALAVALARQVQFGYADNPVETSNRALNMARKAESIDPASPQVLWALGFVLHSRRQFDDAIRALERAIELSPNYADAFGLIALVYANIGDAEKTLQFTRQGMALNPRYQYQYPYLLGMAYYQLEQYETAIPLLEDAVARDDSASQVRIFLIASYVRAGRMDDAHWEVEKLQLLYPSYSLSHLDDFLILSHEAIRERLFSDLRQAGMQ